jgi:glyoxylase-like metal-dependent hydrolase (beta-lactamase superfamily II)
VLYESLQTLLSLRDDVEVYPGHYAGSTCGRGMDGKTISTISRERRSNPALQLDPDEFINYQPRQHPAAAGGFFDNQECKQASCISKGLPRSASQA